LGRAGLDALEARAGPKKWSQDELRELKEYYNAKIKSIGRGEPPQNNSGMAMSELFEDLATPADLPGL
jgi:hypothetical protein